MKTFSFWLYVEVSILSIKPLMAGLAAFIVFVLNIILVVIVFAINFVTVFVFIVNIYTFKFR